MPDQVTDVERVRGWVEADIQRHRTLGEACGERNPVGGVVDESTRGEVVEKVHMSHGARCWR